MENSIDLNSRPSFSVLKIQHFVHITSVILSLIIFLFGSTSADFNVTLWGVLILFFSNIVYGFCEKRKRMVFLVFHFCFFTFLLTRPFISMLKGDDWWYFTPAAVVFALNALYFSLLLLRFGTCLWEVTSKKIDLKKKQTVSHSHPIVTDSSFIKALRFVSFWLFVFSMIFFLITQIEKLQFIDGKEYSDIYIDFKSELPGLVLSISTLSTFALRIYLATLPSKKMAFLVLAVNVVAAVPDLIIGARGSIVLNVLFALVYCIFRDIIRKPGEKRWIGKFEIAAIVIIVPVALVFFGAYNYLRDATEYEMSYGELLVDFFYKQGVSFDVLCRAFEALPNMVHKVYQNFTFGPLIDYFTRSGLGNYIFSSSDLGSQNSEILATFGNSFSHSMSFIAHPAYLEGHGWGSCFFLEFYADWGYLGLAIGSLIFGGLLSILNFGFAKKGVLAKTFVLCTMPNIFFAPRAGATEWLTNIFSIGFVFTLVVCFGFAFLFKKHYIFNKGRSITMFDQCGFLDVLYALWKNKFVIIVVTVLCFIVGFAGEKVVVGKSMSNLIVSEPWIESAYYEVTDTLHSNEDLSGEKASSILALAKSDFSVNEIFNSINQKYTNEQIIDYLGIIGVSPENLCGKDIVSFLCGEVPVSTSIININVSSGNREFSGDLFKLYKSSLEKYAKEIDNCQCKFINSVSFADSKVSSTENALSFDNLKLILGILGFVVVCCVVILKAFFAPTINRKTDFELFDIPVLGEIK